jgi:S1-C subfamily serine protease
VRARIRVPVVDTVDGGLGLVLGAVLAVGVVWIVGAVALQTPGIGLRRDAQRSRILRALNDVLPPSGLLHALARFDPLPQFAGPSPQGVAAPPPRIAHDPQVRAASRGVVRVLGTACGLAVEGSGWVARPGLVVTNAHVVAGEDDTTVQDRGQGPKLSARVVLFDATNDLALLRVPALGAGALPTGSAPPGRAAAVLGFPHNGPYDVRAARVGQTQDVLAPDAYGRGQAKRSVTTFRGVVKSGNSGGPLVDDRGRVVGTVFASAIHARPRAGYAVPSAVVRRHLASAGSRRVGTGPCGT